VLSQRLALRTCATLIVLTCCAALVGCRGVKLTKEKVAQIKLGQTTEAELKKILGGSPTEIKEADPGGISAAVGTALPNVTKPQGPFWIYEDGDKKLTIQLKDGVVVGVVPNGI
jgi:hypothetical protein